MLSKCLLDYWFLPWPKKWRPQHEQVSRLSPFKKIRRIESNSSIRNMVCFTRIAETNHILSLSGKKPTKKEAKEQPRNRRLQGGATSWPWNATAGPRKRRSRRWRRSWSHLHGTPCRLYSATFSFFSLRTKRLQGGQRPETWNQVFQGSTWRFLKVARSHIKAQVSQGSTLRFHS